jgi:molybdate transport system permease protein
MFGLTGDDLSIVALSLKIAAAATLASLPLGVAVALALARGRFPGHGLLNAVVHLPLVLPPVVTGLLLLRTFGHRGVAGAWLESTFGLVFAFRWTGAALAAAVMGFPLMVRAIRLAIEQVDPRLEDAAATLGASRAWRIATITLPLSVPGILAGMVLAFAKSLGEFGATITFASNIPGETQTISTAVYALLHDPAGDAQAMRLVWVSVIISFIAVAAAEALARRTRRSAA